ncbi:Uncharacterized protein dnm_008590 [Desulfonema magnum]|uniref:Uncharacterized protein n=1 Tax=Desulfonema magnum TaxID=45655 RepID=A0A975BG82_9BACT|nr:Uncharacterized protein dnm_008590 [Desulfonema magnum]
MPLTRKTFRTGLQTPSGKAGFVLSEKLNCQRKYSDLVPTLPSGNEINF